MADKKINTTELHEHAARPVASLEEIARTVHAEMSRIPGATFYNAAKDALDRYVNGGNNSD
jgi:2-C-methyl-D-erythritol 4-phosphate cytidylyltransferase